MYLAHIYKITCGKSTTKRNADILFATKPGRKATEWPILAMKNKK
jgi:hypothetical protein